MYPLGSSTDTTISSASCRFFLSSLTACYLFFLPEPQWESPGQHWVEMVSGHPCLFAHLSMFHHGVWWRLWFSQKCSLSGWGHSLLFLVGSLFLSWKGDGSAFICACWDDHAAFVLYTIRITIHWLSHVESTLHSWGKPHLVTVHNPFHMLSDPVCRHCWGFQHLYSFIRLVQFSCDLSGLSIRVKLTSLSWTVFFLSCILVLCEGAMLLFL